MFTLLSISGALFCASALNVSYGGKVTLSDGITELAGIIVAFDANDGTTTSCTTDVSGNYTISIDTGSYRNLRLRNLEKRITGIPLTVEYTVRSNFRVTSATTEDLRMCRFFEVHGTVLSDKGDTIKGALIESGRDVGFGPPRDRDSSNLTDGAYSILADSGNFRVTVHPPLGLGVNETYFDIAVKKDTLFNLVLPSVITISGVLTNYENDTLKHIGVTFEKTGWQVDSFTNNEGQYSVKLNKGTYSIRIRNGSMGSSASGAPAHLEENVFRDLAISKDTLLNIKLPHFPVVKCSVVTTNGDPVADVIMKSSDGPMATTPLGDIDTTNASGVCILRVRSSVKNNLWITPPAASTYIDRVDSLRTNQDTTLIIRLTKGVTLSGKIFFSDSVKPVSQIAVAIEQGAEQKMVYTNTSGEYSIQLVQGTYRLRLRNPYSMNGTAAGIPSNLEYTVFEQLSLTDSKVVNVRLPYFPVISGTVRNSAGSAMGNVSIRFARWEGAETPPYCETSTDMNGNYSLVIGGGVNRVKVTPPTGGQYSLFTFIESFDTTATKDIYLPDQARGITRITPSVITRGEAGKIVINGLNAQLNAVTAPSDIQLGSGIFIDSIKAVSPITLYAFIRVDSTATTGARDIIVKAGTLNSVGAKLLNITAPASAEIHLDATGKTESEVIISDGTGTELKIPAGTPVVLPPGADSVISYQAPIVKDETTDPAGSDFTNVQRTLEPHGLTFGDTVVLTCQYKNSDVEGINESALLPFYFSDSSNGKGTVGSSILVIDRDTTANQISMVLPHFSMFRLAATGVTGNKTTNQTKSFEKDLIAISTIGRQTVVTFSINKSDSKNNVTVSLYTLQGNLVKRYLNGFPGEGLHNVIINKHEIESCLSTNQYIMRLTIGSRKISRMLLLTK
jgi:hypothetical protein